MSLRRLLACIALPSVLAGILRGDPPQPVPLPFFGIGADSQTTRDLAKWIPQMSSIGITMLRSCSPEQMDYLDAHHVAYGCLLYGLPPGDTADTPGSLPVNDIARWSAMVTARVKAARGRVRYWEVWNEPPNGIGRGQTAADYSRIIVATYDAAHAADPACMVGMAAKSNDVNWLEQTIRAGAKDHFDFITLHPYECLDGIAKNLGTEPLFLNIVPGVRKMLGAQDPAKHGVPIVFTELGTTARWGEQTQAEAVVKAYVMGIAQGVASIEWFEGMDGDSGPIGLLSREGRPRLAYGAMGRLIRLLGQQPRYVGMTPVAGDAAGFLFESDSGHLNVVTWGSDQLPPRSMHPSAIIDLISGVSISSTTHVLTGAPVMLINVPKGSVVRQDASAGFPVFGTEVAGAKSVSITMGTNEIECGLHTLAARDVAGAVLMYGGNARAGSVPGGNLFVVDPQFLCYDTVPIEITATVRRDEANDDAGFKLEYESTGGYKSLGWQTIPADGQWHTLKWRIYDDQFVGKYGYHFGFNSDGNRYDKYAIRNVTVTRLPAPRP